MFIYFRIHIFHLIIAIWIILFLGPTLQIHVLFNVKITAELKIGLDKYE